MSLKELVLETRSYRRFQQEVPISLETLRELVDHLFVHRLGGLPGRLVWPGGG